MRKRLLNREFVAGFLLALFGAAMAWTNTVKRFGVYPRTIFILMIAVGALLMLAPLALPSARRTPLDKVSWYEVAFIAVLVACPALIGWLGFYASSFVVILAVSLLAPQRRGAWPTVKTMLYVLAVTAATYAIFTVVLKIKVPSGLLF